MYEIQNIFRGEAVPSSINNHQTIRKKSFHWNISYGFEYKRDCISKLSIKMLIERETRTGKSNTYWMLLIKTNWVTYKNKLIWHPTTVSVVKQLSLNIIRFFVGHCLMTGANIQPCCDRCILHYKSVYWFLSTLHEDREHDDVLFYSYLAWW